MRVSPPTRGARATRLLIASALAATAVLAAHPDAVAQRPASEAVARADTARRVIQVKVDPKMFGLHDGSTTSLDRAGTGAIRLWDSGTTWPQVETSDGTFDWSRLDQLVADAWANHTEVTFVAAMTPSWAHPGPVSVTSDCPNQQTYPPTVSAFSGFLQAVMAHYKNYQGSGRPGIANYQVWNEANICTFWSGTPGQMAQLVKAAYDTRNATDPQVKLVAPAMVTRLGYQRTGIKSFFATKVGKTPVWKYFNAISLNLYPVDTLTDRHGRNRPGLPEDSMTLLAQVKAILAKDGVPRSIPIWNTEINYGLHTGSNAGTSAKPISDAMQIAYVMRTYLLNAAQGVKRVDWYRYDMGDLSAAAGGLPIGNTLLTDPNDVGAGTLTPAGRAFTRIQSWMKGTLVGTTTKRPCAPNSVGTYVCLIKYSTGVGRVYWNPWRTVKVKVAASARQKTSQAGTTSRVRGGSVLKVGYQPVLVRSRR